MSMNVRLPLLAAVLLAAAPWVRAETPFTDPVPKSVPARSLFGLKLPERAAPARPEPVATRTDRSRQVRGSAKAVPKPPPARLAAATPRSGAAPAARVAATPSARVAAATAARVAAAPAARVAAATAAPVAVAPAAVLGNSASPRAAKQAVDDRADPGGAVADDVGDGTPSVSKPLGEGAYIGSKHRALVRQYYGSSPRYAKSTAQWKIGEPVPQNAALKGVPGDLRARLPVLPPGHQYAQLDGEVVLFAVQSRMVVDGVSRSR